MTAGAKTADQWLRKLVAMNAHVESGYSSLADFEERLLSFTPFLEGIRGSLPQGRAHARKGRSGGRAKSDGDARSRRTQAFTSIAEGLEELRVLERDMRMAGARARDALRGIQAKHLFEECGYASYEEFLERALWKSPAPRHRDCDGGSRPPRSPAPRRDAPGGEQRRRGSGPPARALRHVRCRRPRARDRRRGGAQRGVASGPGAQGPPRSADAARPHRGALPPRDLRRRRGRLVGIRRRSRPRGRDARVAQGGECGSSRPTSRPRRGTTPRRAPPARPATKRTTATKARCPRRPRRMRTPRGRAKPDAEAPPPAPRASTRGASLSRNRGAASLPPGGTRPPRARAPSMTRFAIRGLAIGAPCSAPASTRPGTAPAPPAPAPAAPAARPPRPRAQRPTPACPAVPFARDATPRWPARHPTRRRRLPPRARTAGTTSPSSPAASSPGLSSAAPRPTWSTPGPTSAAPTDGTRRPPAGCPSSTGSIAPSRTSAVSRASPPTPPTRTPSTSQPAPT